MFISTEEFERRWNSINFSRKSEDTLEDRTQGDRKKPSVATKSATRGTLEEGSGSGCENELLNFLSQSLHAATLQSALFRELRKSLENGEGGVREQKEQPSADGHQEK